MARIPSAPSTKTVLSTDASLSWEGDSLDVLRAWPDDTKIDFGFSLREMQQGRAARLPVRPMQSIGKGVFELKAQDADAWYRLIYLARIGDSIYILDCFQKDTAKTERKDIHRATQRMAQVHERLREEKRNAKRKGNG